MTAGTRIAFGTLLIPIACLAAAEPVDLRDPRPRPVEVWFESSPDDRPGQLDATYAWPVTGWVAPGPEAGQTVVRIPAQEMERYLGDRETIEGSVSEFVWVFDAASGHVVSAQFAAAFHEPVELPFFTTRVETATQTRLTTAREAGYRPPVERFGHRIHEFCATTDADCIRVEPRPYDPQTGYVNAVGWIDAVAVAGIEARSFSPMGEAIFRELPPTEAASLDLPADAALGVRAAVGSGANAETALEESAAVSLGPPTR